MSSKTQLNQRLDSFLRKVQNKAFAMAMISVKNRNDALDVVQNAMLAFVDKYKHKPKEEIFTEKSQSKPKESQSNSKRAKPKGQSK